VRARARQIRNFLYDKETDENHTHCRRPRRVGVGVCPCGRAGRYRRDRLIEQYGADAALPDLLVEIAGCERRDDPSGRSGARFSGADLRAGRRHAALQGLVNSGNYYGRLWQPPSNDRRWSEPVLEGSMLHSRPKSRSRRSRQRQLIILFLGGSC
jgi:hypothetical protein